jgi:hypothetical protein
VHRGDLDDNGTSKNGIIITGRSWPPALCTNNPSSAGSARVTIVEGLAG